MPRKSKAHVDLLNRHALGFLVQRPDCAEKIKACLKVLDSICKTRTSKRRDQYISELQKLIKILSIDSTDLLEWKAKYKELQKRFRKEQTKKSELSDRLTRMECNRN